MIDATAERAGTTTLGDEEIAVVTLLATGVSDRRAAKLLGISERTLHRRLRSALDKLGVKTRMEAGYVLGRAGTALAARRQHRSSCHEDAR